MTDRHSVTIVTPCLNRVERIVAAVESVREQTYKGPIEHVIIDGGSTDGTLEVLQRYDNLTVLSEPDKNVYDALNKGIDRARGEIVGLLNSDDVYHRDAVSAAVAAFEAAPAASMACGGADVVDDNNDILVRYDGADNRSLDVHDILFGVPLINARFFRRSMFGRVGLFDIRYVVAADREFLLRAALAHEIAVPVAGMTYAYRHHAKSLTIGGTGAWDRLADDYLRLAEDWLGRSSNLGGAEKDMRRFHAHSVLMGIAAAARRRDMPALFACMSRGNRMNARWPAEAPRILAAWVGRRLFRQTS